MDHGLYSDTRSSVNGVRNQKFSYYEHLYELKKNHINSHSAQCEWPFYQGSIQIGSDTWKAVLKSASQRKHMHVACSVGLFVTSIRKWKWKWRWKSAAFAACLMLLQLHFLADAQCSEYNVLECRSRCAGPHTLSRIYEPLVYIGCPQRGLSERNHWIPGGMCFFIRTRSSPF